ncbi:MAG: DUF1549 and DUF1553 domain-containing protein [Verrucomicrobiota bacterium]
MRGVLVIGILGVLGVSASAVPSIIPKDIQLSGPNSFQRVMVVEVDRAGNVSGEVGKVALRAADREVAVVKDGMVVPRGDGRTTIIAKTSDGRLARTVVEVTGFGKESPWSFRNHVQAVLSKNGCNMGACHGAVAGKGGFRLSLRGYDPEADFHTITREARGRRVELGDPARSLVLIKGTTAVKHTGGRRIESDSLDYRVVSEWIASGAAAPVEGDARLEGLEIFPALSMLAPGDEARFIVRARYSDGREEDVTQWAKFTSTNEAVVNVDDDGNAEVIGHGEGAVTAWFSSQVVIGRLSAPFPNEIPDAVYAEAPVRNFVDERVLEQLRRLNLKPSPRTTDAEFIRRAYVDTIGVLPTLAEVRAFLADERPEKRDLLIDELLERPEFVDYWAYRWSDLMLVNGRRLRPEAVKAYYSFIRENVAANTPWDEFAREVVTATGVSSENGATNFFAVHQDPENMAENVSQVFLSLSINCAKCHNHPLEKWTNDQYYAFANLFSRVRAKGWGGDARNGDGLRTLYVEPRGELIQPRTGQPQAPAPLGAEPVAMDLEGDRREVLAEWLTSPENDAFSRSVANRVWANFFGRGLVESVDDLRVSNPASIEPLLDELSGYLVAQDFDLKALMRVILRSETYQRSSEALPENRDEEGFFSRYYPRRMMAEVLHDAVAGITGVSSEFTEVALRDGSTQKTEFYPEGTRAMSLYDSAVKSYFLKTFGRNEREIACEGERSNQPSLVQVLHLSNGDTVNEKLRAKGSIAERATMQFTGQERKAGALVNEAYLMCLSRYPTKEERKGFVAALNDAREGEERDVVEDLYWALMTSREFLFQR